MSGAYTCPICRARCVSWQARAAHLEDRHGWVGRVVRIYREVGAPGYVVDGYLRLVSEKALAYETIIAQDAGRP